VVSALSGIADVNPAVVWGCAREHFNRLAHDADDGVGTPAFKLYVHLRQLNRDVRNVYEHFGL